MDSTAKFASLAAAAAAAAPARLIQPFFGAFYHDVSGGQERKTSAHKLSKNVFFLLRA